MANKRNDRVVYKHPDGWAEKPVGASRAGSVERRQSDAIANAREKMIPRGGGELTVMGRDGVIRSKDTIPPGNDPPRIKDKEH